MEPNNPEQRLLDLSIELPPAPGAIGIYKAIMQVGDLVYVSGHGPVNSDETLTVGRVGQDVQIEEARQAARQTGLAILASLRTNLGSLDRIGRVIKLFGMVNSTPDFDQQPYVIDGCSELFIQVFGEDNGVGVRSAVGMAVLPGNIPVEIESIFELKSS